MQRGNRGFCFLNPNTQAQTSSCHPLFVGSVPNLALEIPAESSLCGLQPSPFAKLGHIENVPLFRAPGWRCQEPGSVGGQLSAEEEKLRLALPDTHNPFVPPHRSWLRGTRSKATRPEHPKVQPAQHPKAGLVLCQRRRS